MYISIGNDMAVRDRSIVGIFDLDNCSYEKKNPGISGQGREKRRSSFRHG